MPIKSAEKLQIAESQHVINTLSQEIEKHFGLIHGLEYIPEGNYHLNFLVHLESGQELIARMQIKPNVEDPEFNHSSLAREEILYRLLGKHEVRVPQVYARGEHPELGEFLLLERLQGDLLSDYLEKRKHTLHVFLEFHEHLGISLAQIHKIRMSKFGEIVPDSTMSSPALSYAQYLRSLYEQHIQRPEVASVFGATTIEAFQGFVEEQLKTIEDPQHTSVFHPHLVLGDHHAHNVIIDENHSPGFFDVDTCKAATAAHDFFLIRAQFCAYYYDDVVAYQQANEALKRGYLQGGGDEVVFSSLYQKVELLLTTLSIFATVMNYRKSEHAYSKTWSAEFYALLLKILYTRKFNPMDYMRIVCSKTQQPKYATRDFSNT